MEPNNIHTEISSFIGKLIRDHFGKGPESVHVSMGSSYITMYIRGFLSSIEKVLMSQKQEELVQTTRDLIMQSLIPEIKAHIKVTTGMELREFYYDWGMHNRSALFVGISTPSSAQWSNGSGDRFEGQEPLHEEVIKISELAQKRPEEIHSCCINSRTFIVVRNGILVAIEKQLIRQGLREQLRIAKRSLEKGLLHNNNRFETILDAKITDCFVDWDFDLDKSVIVFVTKKPAESRLNAADHN